MSSTTLAYRLGGPDAECRYPVIIGEDMVIGLAFRWHRNWMVQDSAGEHTLGRPAKGEKGEGMAAAHLVKQYAAGLITATRLIVSSGELGARAYGPVPLLHWRMPATERNLASAYKAWAGVTELRWRPHGGFPGADNWWMLECEMPGCDWVGPRYWSHLRGRNGQPPSAYRHPGCIGEDKVRALIAAYQQ
ncbi:hypothetical protein [Streptomyces sp. SPB4]|uniref:hypothetical protein n=1 Tax=Streptomyces sp. SPB4 TaxID=2940553 RepID=UPI002476AFC3|nr:hypothetical protein [Streptomyces sp. SPB4]MDH6545563.1 hypothetical protein [Streptomyces sp. SPB4]